MTDTEGALLVVLGILFVYLLYVAFLLHWRDRNAKKE